jgi:2-polyprenyl-6-methoxyphenol hydroxylase-like FAD-dependent oxidoreductase
MTTRIGIVGAGAIGSIVGGLLTKAGHDATLIDPPFNDAVVELVRRHGVGTLRPDPRNLDPLLPMLPRA